MRIKFLGTGAADWPSQKEEGVLEFRRLSSALVDGTILIDPGPQVLDALDEFSIDPRSIRYILITHKHSDHYNRITLEALLSLGAELMDLGFGEEAVFGKYTVSAYAGNHSTCDETKHYIISDGKSKLFYGLDSAWLLYDEVQAIIEKKIDYAVLDATIGDIEGDYRIFEHNNLNMIREMKQTLAPYVKRFCISHMARTLHTSHNELNENMKESGIEVAFDGMEAEF